MPNDCQIKTSIMKHRIFFTYAILVLIAFVSCKDKKSTEVIDKPKEAEKELKTLDVNDYSFHYIDIGEGEPLIFVHGSIGDYRAWEAQIDTFATKYRVIVPSRRYAWPNTQPVSDTLDYSAGQHAKDLALIIKKLNLEPAHLVGHSWGGYTVLKTAVDHPELVQSMVLGEPAAATLIMGTKEGDSLMGDFYQNALAPAAKNFTENRPEDAIRSFVGGVMGDTAYFDTVPQVMRDIWMQNTAETEGSSITDGFTPISPDEVARLEIPTLLIQGEKSPDLFIKIVDTLHARLPNSTLYELPNASHGLQLENPKEFNKAVLQFLNGL